MLLLVKNGPKSPQTYPLYLSGSSRSIPLADLDPYASGDAGSIAGHVCSLGYRVNASDVDLLGDFYRVVDLNAEVAQHS